MVAFGLGEKVEASRRPRWAKWTGELGIHTNPMPTVNQRLCQIA
jgi:hypothetical protein